MVKRKNSFAILFLALYCCSCLVPSMDANLGGYTVEPGNPGMVGAPAETEKVPVWAFTPRDIATIFALSVSSVFLFPVELFFILKLFAFLGYRKIARNNVLEHHSRNAVYQCIRDNPGIPLIGISEMTRIKPGTLQYHLSILKLVGKIALLDTNGRTRYFENSGKFSDTEKNVIRHMHRKNERAIFEVLINHPGSKRIDLEEKLKISGVAVTWHMQRLSDDSIISIRKSGRNAQYIISPEAMRYIRKYLLSAPEKNLT